MHGDAHSRFVAKRLRRAHEGHDTAILLISYITLRWRSRNRRERERGERCGRESTLDKLRCMPAARPKARKSGKRCTPAQGRSSAMLCFWARVRGGVVREDDSCEVEATGWLAACRYMLGVVRVPTSKQYVYACGIIVETQHEWCSSRLERPGWPLGLQSAGRLSHSLAPRAFPRKP